MPKHSEDEAQPNDSQVPNKTENKLLITNASALACPTDRQLRIMRCVSIILALTSFGCAYFGLMEDYLIGFPDGHITDYYKAAAAPLLVLTGVHAGLGLGFVALASSKRLAHCLYKYLPLLIAILALVHLIRSYGIAWLLINCLGLDNGIGG